MSGAGPISAKDRQRVYRARQRAGEVVVSVRALREDVAALVRRGFLHPAQVQDRAAVGLAIERLLDAVGRQ